MRGEEWVELYLSSTIHLLGVHMDEFTFYPLRKIWTLQLKSLFTDDQISKNDKSQWCLVRNFQASRIVLLDVISRSKSQILQLDCVQ